MLSLLLENGADPNRVYNGVESALWDLQYNDGQTDEGNETRLKMAQLLLEYGANSNMDPENEPEDLFEWVYYMLGEDNGDLWAYRSRFFILLVAYGGKVPYLVPAIVKPFDKTKMEQYRFRFKFAKKMIKN